MTEQREALRRRHVVVETARGVECGEVAMANRDVADDSIVQPLKKVIRKATKDDLRRVAENELKAKNAFTQCEKKIAERGLEMKLVDVEYTFDNSKILFYFTADGRVDFRELVKDLAGMFRTRIELRQIGVRDEAKDDRRPRHLRQTVLLRLVPRRLSAGLHQNGEGAGTFSEPVKISGTCGRLMCCLKYEQEAYLDLLRTTPKVNAVVSTPDGKGVVIDQNLLTGKLTVRLDKSPDAAPSVYKVKDVRVLKDGQIKLNKKEIEEFKKLEN